MLISFLVIVELLLFFGFNLWGSVEFIYFIRECNFFFFNVCYRGSKLRDVWLIKLGSLMLFFIFLKIKW